MAITRTNKTCLVAGGSAGIGRETALGLARQGHTVYIVGRDGRQVSDAVAGLREQSGNPFVHGALADLSSLQSIHDLGLRLRRQLPTLDILVNNAGSLFTAYQLSAEGFEKNWAQNHLAQAALTLELLPALAITPRARIVTVSSALHGQGRMDFERLRQVPTPGAGFRALESYAQAMLATVLFTYALARRLQGSGVSANCLHPGAGHAVCDAGRMTRLASRLMQPFRQSPVRGAQTVLRLALAPELQGISGAYFTERGQVLSSLPSRDIGLQERLWALSLEQVGRGTQAAVRSAVM
jgi:NAD(P)-dependent dehydrogenase (short-subunit alcohol dehydrogenase family)